jgi:hypothetical protein
VLAIIDNLGRARCEPIRYFRRRSSFFAVRPAPILPSRLALAANVERDEALAVRVGAEEGELVVVGH